MGTEWSLAVPTLRDGMEPTDDWRDLTERAKSAVEEPEMDPTEAVEFWCQWLVERSRRHYDTVVLVTGDEGSGKSTLAMQMARRCAEIQGYRWSPDDVCFSAADLLTQYRKVTETGLRGWPVWYDEGVRGTSAYETQSAESRAIIKALALVRESGAILFALYPDVFLASLQIRARRARLWIHVVRRGLGRVHERDQRLRYIKDQTLGFAISPRAPHVAWEAFREDDPVWLRYLKTKHLKLMQFLRDTEEELHAKAGRGARQKAASLRPKHRSHAK